MSAANKNESRYSKPYNDNEDRTILLESRKGTPFSEIVKKLSSGRTAGGVRARYKYITEGHKKPSSNIPDSEAVKIAKMHLDGKRTCEICSETGWSDRTVSRIEVIADAAIDWVIEKLMGMREGDST